MTYLFDTCLTSKLVSKQSKKISRGFKRSLVPALRGLGEAFPNKDILEFISIGGKA